MDAELLGDRPGRVAGSEEFECSCSGRVVAATVGSSGVVVQSCSHFTFPDHGNCDQWCKIVEIGLILIIRLVPCSARLRQRIDAGSRVAARTRTVACDNLARCGVAQSHCKVCDRDERDRWDRGDGRTQPHR